MAVTACVALFGQERGREVHELMERVVGGPCPCLASGTCPLLGQVERAQPPMQLPASA